MNAVSLHSTVNQIGQIIGPAAAGGIIELAGIGTPLMVKTVLAMTLRANSVSWWYGTREQAVAQKGGLAELS